MTINEEKLWNSFRSLGRDEHYVLKVLSVIYEPVNQTELQDALRALGDPGSNLINKAWREKMLRHKLIEQTSGRLRCQPLLSSTLSYEALKDGTFARIEVRGAGRTRSSWMNNDFLYDPWRFRRHLRNALFLHDEAKLMSLLAIDAPYARPARARARVLFEVAVPIVGQWFHELPDAFKFQLLQFYFSIQSLSLQDTSPMYVLAQESFEQKVLDSAYARTLLAEQALYRADHARFEAFSAGIETHAMLALHAASALIMDDNALALELFQKSLAAKKKANGTRAAHIPEIPGVFYCLALVKAGDTEAVKHLKTQCKVAGRKNEDEPLLATFLLLQAFRDIWDGRVISHDELEDYQFDDLNHRYPIEIHMLGLAWYWLGKPLFPALKATLEKLLSDARSAGFSWQANDIEQLLAALAGGEPRGLAAMMPRLQPWERALDALAAINQKPAPAVSDQELADTRLAWVLSREYGAIRIEPREQKRRKQSGWTKGRPVALRRLAEEPESFADLAPEDMAICRCIRRDAYRYGGGGGWFLDEVTSLRAAVGHPRIFWADDLDNPITILAKSPELMVKRTGDQVAISIFPDPLSDGERLEDFSGRQVDKLTMIIEGAGTVEVIDFNAELLQIARILDGGLKVPATAEDRVIQSIVAISPLLTVHSDLQSLASTAAEAVPADPRLYLNMQPTGGELKLTIGVQPFGEGPRFLPGAGGETVFAEISGKSMQATRDLEKETQVLQQVVDSCPGLVDLGGGNWSFTDMAHALEALLTLQQMGESLVFAWPAGKQLKMATEVGVKSASLSIRSKTNWFEVAGEVQVGEAKVLDMQKLLELMGNAPGRFIQLGDNEFVALTEELRRRLERLRSISAGNRVHGMAGLHLEELAEGMTVSADQRWQEFKQRLEASRDIKPELPTTFEGSLRAYQRAGFDWLSRLAAWGAGACLADDMGLGKTIQSLALVVSRAPTGPTLVLAPTSVCMNWMDEAAQFAPTLNPVLFGTGDRQQTIKSLGPFDVLVCTYGLLASESDLLTSIQWCTIVADEAQAFKNASTQRSKSVMQLNGEFRMLTTGTPIENHLGELWNLFNFINPGLLGSLEHFNQTFARPIENGNADARERLKQLISPFVLRRLKREVLTELPPRTDITLTVEPSEDELTLYEALRREAIQTAAQAADSENRQRMIVLAQITRLRQAACNPSLVLPGSGIASSKLEAFGNLVNELLENGHKALVFSQFVGHLALVRKYLDDKGIAYQYLDGSTRQADRKRAVNAFQAGETDLFLISLKAGGTGLNLTAANYVIHLDPWWNPAVEDQASDRAHRIGQQRPVTVYRLVTADTIEQKIVELHRQKRDLADSLLEGSDIGARLTLADMLALIGQGPHQ